MELAQTYNMLQKIKGCFVNQFPSGRWGFVGSVPVPLSFRQLDGSPATDAQIEKVRQFGKGLVRDIKTASWPTKEEALAAAAELGFEVQNA